MFDLIVLGGGPAGYTGAIRAAKLGMSVALIEGGEVGGTCLNRGCIPTKCLLHSSALFASRAGWAECGVRVESVTFDEGAAYSRKDGVVASLRGGVEKLLAALGVKVIKARGVIADAHTVLADGERIEGKNLLIATGSRPAVLPVKGAEGALTSDGVLSEPLPAGDVVIVGGGVIGMELACYFADCGRGVTVLEYAERVLPFFGKELSVQLASALKRRGVKIVTSARVTEIGEGYALYECGGAEQRAEGGAVVAATGRRANVEGIGLPAIGLPETPIFTDENMMTLVPGVYAAGDVTGGIQLAHYASACALKAVAHMAGKPSDIDLATVPSLVYTSPEVVSVGRTDEAAKTGKFLLGANGRNLANGSNRGFIKIYCDDKGVIVGAEAFGDGVTELSGELSLAVSKGMTAEEVAAVIHAHPTLSESVAEACEDVFGLATHKR